MAIAIVAAATALRWAVIPWMGTIVPYDIAILSVVVTTLLLGIGPGLLSVLLGAVAVEVFVMQPIAAPLTRETLVRLGTSLSICSTIILILHIARLRSHRSETRIAAFAAAMLEGIVESEEGRILDCNEQFARLLGYTAAELKGSAIADFVAPEDRERVLANISANRESVIEHAVLRKDGARIVVEAHGRPIAPDDPRRYTAVRDVTERKQSEQAVRENEARQKAAEAVEAERKRLFEVLETLPAMICLLTPDYHVAFTNRSFRERFGESGGRHCHEYCFGSTDPCKFCQAHRVLRTGQAHHWEIAAPDGSVIDVYDFPFTDADGSPLILKMKMDISERRKYEVELARYREQLEDLVRERTARLETANIQLHSEIAERELVERSLRESEERFRQMADDAPVMIWVTEPDGACSFVSRSWLEFTGQTPDQALGFGWLDALHPEDRATAGDAFRYANSMHQLYRSEYRLRRHDGTYRWILDTAAPRTGAQGEFLGYIGSVLDITERKQTEESLRQSREDLDRAQEVGQMGWWRLDTRQNVLTWSEETHRIFGVPVGKPMTYETFLSAIHPDDRAYVDTKWKAGLAGEPYDVEHRIVTDGRVKWVREKAYLEFDQGGNLLGGFGISQDITQLKMAEQRLRELNETLEHRVSERTAEVQQLAYRLRALALDLSQTEQRERKRLAKILHDHIQQILVAARLQLEWVKRDTRPERLQATTRAVDAMLKEAIESSRSLTLDLSPPVLHDAGLAGGLNWLAVRMMEKNRFTVNLRADNKAEPASEEIRLLLFECVRELLFNAVKHSGVSEADVELLRTADDAVKITVRDAGVGFDPDLLHRRSSAEPTFGLFSIQQRLVHIGGKMDIDAAPGKGARITLTAPIGPIYLGPAETITPRFHISLGETITIRPSPNSCRVLVVDDHRIVRGGLRELLQLEPDIEVVGEAADGPQAIELAAGLAPDVIIMDVNLGEMSGVEATRKILAGNPDIKIIALSMYTDRNIVNAMRDAGAVAYLTKGGPTEDLLSAIRACSKAQ